jgi:uracil phosphoribosyltransferase
LVVSILGSAEGVTRAANEAQGVEIFVGAVDKELGGSGGGMIVPGLVLLLNIVASLLMVTSVGDIGDRLFLTIGK